jgi:hypothetical protein
MAGYGSFLRGASRLDLSNTYNDYPATSPVTPHSTAVTFGRVIGKETAPYTGA